MRSAALQGLIDKGLFDRIPATFSTYSLEQIRDWDTLFPAERLYFERLFTLLDRLAPAEFEELMEPLRAVEKWMGVNERNWPRRRFTLDQVDFLNRNPHYAAWRAEIARIFSRLDPVLDAETALKGRPRLAAVISPPELPVGPDRMWKRLTGRRLTLETPFSAAEDLAPLLAAGTALPYDRWLIQTGDALPGPPGSVHLSYDSLAAYRERLMNNVHSIVERERIRGPRELGARLKQMKILPAEGGLASDPILAEFTRAVLLAGNGTLLINNTFVEWATLQAVRRARPSVLIAGFGVRNKLKPFSSLLIYSDQEKTNPIPTQMDTLGTYVDLEIFYQYIWQEFGKYAEYQRNTVFLFAGEGMDEALVIAPPDFRPPPKLPSGRLTGLLREWMQL